MASSPKNKKQKQKNPKQTKQNPQKNQLVIQTPELIFNQAVKPRDSDTARVLGRTGLSSVSMDGNGVFSSIEEKHTILTTRASGSQAWQCMC